MDNDSNYRYRKSDIFNPDNPSRTIILSGDIESEMVHDIIEKILYINEYDEDNEETIKDYVRKPIKLIINSFGGSVYDGFAIIGVIENSKTPIHTYCYGSAMSMSLLIFVSGHFRYAHRLCTIMYHECLDQPNYDKLATLRENIDETRRIMEVYDEHLLSKTMLKRTQLEKSKQKKFDWYMNADMALKLGIADEII
jgi:ATP-dependent Clp protease protease subunit